MIRSFIVGCKCAQCRAKGRRVVRYAQRKLRRESRQLIRQMKFDEIAKVSYGWPPG